MSRIYLARHGATSWSESGQHTSFTDLDLTPAGEAAAKAMGERLRGRRFGLVLVSPRLRARRTAELAGVTDAVTDDELVEWDYGDYEGLTTDQIRETAPGWTVFSSPCPNGETASQVGARADRVLARVAAAAVEDALLIGHGHALRVLAARWLRQPAAFGAHLELAVSTLSNLGWERETPTVETWNA
ncbi:MAG TPA: histidine phosphatase family protein [Actinopolymorphaceae bacterium]